MSIRRYVSAHWPAVLLGSGAALVAVVLWHGVAWSPPAYGQIPDSGEQRNEMIRELRESNQKLKEIADILRDIRELQVAAKKAEAAKPTTTRP